MRIVRGPRFLRFSRVTHNAGVAMLIKPSPLAASGAIHVRVSIYRGVNQICVTAHVYWAGGDSPRCIFYQKWVFFAQKAIHPWR